MHVVTRADWYVACNEPRATCAGSDHARSKHGGLGARQRVTSRMRAQQSWCRARERLDAGEQSRSEAPERFDAASRAVRSACRRSAPLTLVRTASDVNMDRQRRQYGPPATSMGTASDVD
jgi:hypothetical protein